MSETRLRSLVKAIGWRILSFLGTVAILCIYGNPTWEAILQAFTISLGAIALYYIYERIWLRIKWGRKED